MRILLALTRYGQTGEGDVKRLTDREGLCLLRVGKWRVLDRFVHSYGAGSAGDIRRVWERLDLSWATLTIDRP